MIYEEFEIDRSWDSYDIRDAFVSNLKLPRFPLHELKLPPHLEHNLPEMNKNTDKK